MKETPAMISCKTLFTVLVQLPLPDYDDDDDDGVSAKGQMSAAEQQWRCTCLLMNRLSLVACGRLLDRVRDCRRFACLLAATDAAAAAVRPAAVHDGSSSRQINSGCRHCSVADCDGFRIQFQVERVCV